MLRDLGISEIVWIRVGGKESGTTRWAITEFVLQSLKLSLTDGREHVFVRFDERLAEVGFDSGSYLSEFCLFDVF